MCGFLCFPPLILAYTLYQLFVLKFQDLIEGREKDDVLIFGIGNFLSFVASVLIEFITGSLSVLLICLTFILGIMSIYNFDTGLREFCKSSFLLFKTFTMF
jgi:hypothetical protein